MYGCIAIYSNRAYTEANTNLVTSNDLAASTFEVVPVEYFDKSTICVTILVIIKGHIEDMMPLSYCMYMYIYIELCVCIILCCSMMLYSGLKSGVLLVVLSHSSLASLVASVFLLSCLPNCLPKSSYCALSHTCLGKCNFVGLPNSFSLLCDVF